MIDHIISITNQLRPAKFDITYDPKQSLTEVSYTHIAAHTTLTVVFPPYHLPAYLGRRLVQRHSAEGSDTLLYDFSPSILHADGTKVAESFQFIADHIAERVNTLASNTHYQNINLLSFSLGNAAMAVTAERMNRFNAVTMIVPGTHLLPCLWYGMRTRTVREQLEQRGTTYAELEQQWKDLGPIEHMDLLKGHPLDIVLSAKDDYVPIRFGRQLVDALETNGNDPHVVTVSTGHVRTIVNVINNGLPQ